LLAAAWMLEEISGKFDDHQYGALKGRSTTHELVNILHICHQAADFHQSTRTYSSISPKHSITLIAQ
jgi:hypothetical protein